MIECHNTQRRHSALGGLLPHQPTATNLMLSDTSGAIARAVLARLSQVPEDRNVG